MYLGLRLWETLKKNHKHPLKTETGYVTCGEGPEYPVCFLM